MFTLHIYLNFNGECEAAFNLYKSVFGGEFEMLSRMGDVPATEGFPEMSEEQKNKIMHVCYPISNLKLFGSDVPENTDFTLIKGNNNSISIDCKTKEEADRFFAALSEGGQITMPIGDTFWGAYFGMCIDKFGILWMVNYDYPQQNQ